MKVKMFFVILALLISSHLYAQNFSQEKKVAFSFGLVGGGNFSTISTSSPVEADFGFRPGFNAGVAANIRFWKRNELSSAKTGLMAVQPEIRYATMGANSDESRLGLGYIMVPIMLQVYPAKKFYIEVGPEFALNISHTPDNIAQSSYQINLENFRPNDVMLGAGIGFMHNGFTAGLRYSLGFSKLASNLPWKNNLIQVNIGYLFSLKPKSPEKIIVW